MEGIHIFSMYSSSPMGPHKAQCFSFPYIPALSVRLYPHKAFQITAMLIPPLTAAHHLKLNPSENEENPWLCISTSRSFRLLGNLLITASDIAQNRGIVLHNQLCACCNPCRFPPRSLWGLCNLLSPRDWTIAAHS